MVLLWAISEMMPRPGMSFEVSRVQFWVYLFDNLVRDLAMGWSRESSAVTMRDWRRSLSRFERLMKLEMAKVSEERVPVLSKMMFLDWARVSRKSPDFETMPRVESFQRPLQMARGVARPRAQGQATRRTDMELKRALIQSTWPSQKRKVPRATVRTKGRNHCMTASAWVWRLDGERLASSTVLIRESNFLSPLKAVGLILKVPSIE